MSRIPIIAGNWKMNNTLPEAVVLAQEISNRVDRDIKERIDVVVCPPFIDLKPVWTVFDFDKCPIEIGAQNVYWEPSGAFTGEISIPMLEEIDCRWCIVGHSERRGYFGETNEDVNNKVRALIQAEMHPIICVGESLAVRDDNSYVEFVCAQVRAAFAGIEESDVKDCVVAYEPIWAIGTGRTATPEQAEEVCAAIREEIAKMYSSDAAEEMRVLYGGSMKPANVEALIAQPNIDGGLIGGASLNADSFKQLIEACL